MTGVSEGKLVLLTMMAITPSSITTPKPESNDIKLRLDALP